MKVLIIVLGCLLLSMTASAAFINCPSTSGGGTTNSFPDGAGTQTAACAAFVATAGFHVTSIDLRYITDYSIGVDPTTTFQVVYTITSGNVGFTSPVTGIRTGGVFSTSGGLNNMTVSGLFLASVGAINFSEVGSLTAGSVDQGSARIDIQYNQTADNIVPEPTTILSLGGGLLALAAFARRFKKA